MQWIVRQLLWDTHCPQPRMRIERRIGNAVEYEIVITKPVQIVGCVLTECRHLEGLAIAA